LVFGREGQLPPLQLKTPDGNEVLLRGKIDRVDIDLQQSRYTVIDYKLGGESLSLGYVAHGLMLQLLTYLLVIDTHGEKLAGKRLTPAAALYVRMLRSIDSTTDPAAEPAPETPEFHTKSKMKPRGLINALSADDLDADFAATGQSQAFAMRRKKDGTFYESGCDAVEADQFQALVAFVHDKIITLADQIIGGQIAVEPYLIGSDSPCPNCAFKRVCRFDRLVNRYRVLPALSHKDALKLITDPEGDA
jgi:ATP-dependent helicase/nuclease subunit B